MSFFSFLYWCFFGFLALYAIAAVVVGFVDNVLLKWVMVSFHYRNSEEIREWLATNPKWWLGGSDKYQYAGMVYFLRRSDALHFKLMFSEQLIDGQ